MLGLGGNDHAAKAVAMSVQEFSRRMDHEISAQRDGPLEVRRHESVVYNQLCSATMRQPRHCGDIGERHQRIRGRLNEDKLGIPANGFFDGCEISRVYVGELQSEVGEDLIEKPRHAAVDVVSADDVVTGTQHGAESIDSCHAAGEYVRCTTAFESSEIFFQAGTRRIRDTRVLVPFIFPNLLLHVGGGRVNGNRDGSGEWVCFLSGVDGGGGKTKILLFHD